MLREPTVAGRFYQQDPQALREQLESCYSHKLGVQQQTIPVSGKLQAMISPHAGYIFSGPPASFGFARLKKESRLPERVILLGPKHTHYGPNFAISSARIWRTPLGDVEVDVDFCDAVCQAVKDFELDCTAHQYEHSLEVQLPFLQDVYLDQPFRIVPIALGFASFASLEIQIAALKSFITPEILADSVIVVSSDFSHDTPKEQAYRLDAEVIEKIKAFDAKGFYDLVVGEERSVCGLMPITALLLLLDKNKYQASLLAYSTSMDIMEHERGVGYASIIFEERQ